MLCFLLEMFCDLCAFGVRGRRAFDEVLITCDALSFYVKNKSRFNSNHLEEIQRSDT